MSATFPCNVGPSISWEDLERYRKLADDDACCHIKRVILDDVIYPKAVEVILIVDANCRCEQDGPCAYCPKSSEELKKLHIIASYIGDGAGEATVRFTAISKNESALWFSTDNPNSRRGKVESGSHPIPAKRRRQRDQGGPRAQARTVGVSSATGKDRVDIEFFLQAFVTPGFIPDRNFVDPPEHTITLSVAVP